MMNRFLKNLALVSASAVLFVSCGDSPTPEGPKLDDGLYAGTFSVAPGTPAAFTIDDVEVLFTVDDGGTQGQIKMMKVKFAERMPEMDITIPGVTLTEKDNEYTFSCDENGIVPIMAGGPFPDRLITELVGNATPENLSLSFVCMTLSVSFTGTRMFDM